MTHMLATLSLGRPHTIRAAQGSSRVSLGPLRGFSLLASGSPTRFPPGFAGGMALELLRRAVSKGLLCQAAPRGPAC